MAYDTEVAEEALSETLAKIKPWRKLRPIEITVPDNALSWRLSLGDGASLAPFVP